jgi:hypothetical protein
MGLARARDEKTYTYTLRGGYRNALNYVHLGKDAEKAAQLVEKAEKWYDAEQARGVGSVVGGAAGASFDA